MNDRNITNARFIQFNQLPQIDSHLTAKLYVDREIDQTLLVRNNQDNDFQKYNLTNINSITLNKQPENDNQVVTKAYINQFHQENERSRRDLGIDFYNDSNDLVKLNDNSNDRYLQVRVNNTAYNLQINNQTQIMDTTKLIFPNTGDHLLQNWLIICNNKMVRVDHLIL